MAQRHYQAIWEKIKDAGKCSIAAAPPLHKRIISAVKKEKDTDLGFKLIMGEEGRRTKLKIEKQQSKITFTLVKSIGTADL